MLMVNRLIIVLVLVIVWFDPLGLAHAQNHYPDSLPSQIEVVPLGVNSQGYSEYLWLADSAVMISVPAGSFTMGSNDLDSAERPPHRVYLSEYLIDKYEVTNQQYRRFCDATGRGQRRYWFFWHRDQYPIDPGFDGMKDYFTCYPDYPVVNVSWEDAQAYCVWAGKTLPTEAQWEKAARGTDARRYPWGDSIPDGRRCNFADQTLATRSAIPSQIRLCDTSTSDGFAWTSPVGLFPSGASPYGCLDIAGNVWEWCRDQYGWYSADSCNDPQGPTSGEYHVARGGCWRREARLLQCAFRHPGGIRDRVITLGFRTASARPIPMH
jgi:eukaryotic-like serine/threonine-protein kinase